MQRKFLEGLGLEKSIIDKILNENGTDIEKAKERLETERDNYKSQLETAQTALKKFEGVNVEELKGEIEKLNGDLAAKETCRILPSYIFIIRCYIGIRCSLGLLPFNTLGNKSYRYQREKVVF